MKRSFQEPSPASIPSSGKVARSQELAESKKEAGNGFYKEHKYSQALACYSEAISICPDHAAYYGNRSATYIMLQKFKDGLADAQFALQLDKGFVKGYLREGKCHLALGSPVAALRSYRQALELEPNNEIAQKESTVAAQVQANVAMAEANFAKADYKTAISNLDRCIENCPAAIYFKIRKAEATALTGKYLKALEQIDYILMSQGMNADAVYVRGMCLYYRDITDKALQHFQEVLRRAPDHHKAKDIYRKAKALLTMKEGGNAAFLNGRYQDAYSLYSDALSIDPNNKCTNSKIFFNRATVCSVLGRFEDAIQDYTKAIEMDEAYLMAYMRRAKCYTDTEKYEEAVKDYEHIYKTEKTMENKMLLQSAKIQLRRSLRKDYYMILGVEKTATEDEIRKAYRKLAMIHHPDRHLNDTPEKQKEEEKKFQELGEAYNILSDPRKKACYDNGVEEGGFAETEDGEGGEDDDIGAHYHAGSHNMCHCCTCHDVIRGHLGGPGDYSSDEEDYDSGEEEEGFDEEDFDGELDEEEEDEDEEGDGEGDDDGADGAGGA